MFLSLCYVVLRRVLQLAALRGWSNEFKDLEIVVLRHELAILRRRRPSGDHVDRPDLPCGSQPIPAAGSMAIFHHHAGDAASVASALGGEALDIRASSRSPGDSA